MGTTFLGIACDTNLVTVRGHNKLMNILMRDGAQAYRDKILPLHFETEAERRYHYKPRTRAYNEMKLKRVGYIKPLVFSGRMREMVLRESKVTATKDRSRIYIKNYFPMKDEIRAELEVILESERADFVRELKKQYQARIGDPAYARKRRQKGGGP